MGVNDLRIALDSVWVMVAACLVFFMQAGFAMVEAGFTRSKNTGNIVMKNLMDFAVSSVIYWLFGFALMYGAGNSFIGWKGLALTDSFAHLGLALPLPLFLFFQTVFAGTAATIVSGAMAERTKFTSYLIYSAVISALIYPVVGHWTWGGGWLSKLGFIDFAGSTVVHSVGGWASLAGVMVLGPRIGKYETDGSPRIMHGHNMLAAALGVFILWFGWFGFNPGSTLAADGKTIGHVAITTNLAAATGALGAMFFCLFLTGKFDVGMTLNGVLAGLVAITAGTAAVSPPAAAVIGLLAGIIVVLAVNFFEKVRLDDAVGAISVHGVCGAFGTLAVGLFAEEGGLLYGGGWWLLGVQSLGILAAFLWSFPLAYLLFRVLKATIGLRVSAQEELEGLDLSEHGHSAYPEQFDYAKFLAWLKQNEQQENAS